jgi:hypothetical protein
MFPSGAFSMHSGSRDPFPDLAGHPGLRLIPRLLPFNHQVHFGINHMREKSNKDPTLAMLAPVSSSSGQGRKCPFGTWSCLGSNLRKEKKMGFFLSLGSR